jgi:hypothetical protein
MRERSSQGNAKKVGGPRLRRSVIAGTAGVAVIGAGAYLITSRVQERPEVARSATGVVVAEPSVTAASGMPSTLPPASSAPARVRAAETSASPAATGGAAASTSGAKPLVMGSQDEPRVTQRPIPHKGGVWATDAQVHRSQVTVGHDILRITSARRDLAGQRELSWIPDAGEKVGDASCSNKVRLTAGAPEMVKPTLLLCWRTTAAKSVFVISVNPTGRPSKTAAAAAVDKEWRRMG